jgi:maltooligosyltrehalose trehalohydrolase
VRTWRETPPLHPFTRVEAGQGEGVTDYRVWAPTARSVDLVAPERSWQRTPMTRDGEWWHATDDLTDYAFCVDNGDPRPDPRSGWQPQGVHRPSRTYDHRAFAWTDADWPGTPLEGSVLYELHVGTFTAAGTFDGAIDRLDHLAALGVTAVELLPCNAFDGQRGWGYDGVALYAVYGPYGGPDGLKRFVDAAHSRGIGVVMDVVYNHFGPAGNYLPEFGPYLTEAHHTPWGAAVNLGHPEVRRFFLDNALMWLRDYHVDGLRLDAVHALIDDSPTHLLRQLADEVGALGEQLGKPLWLVAESDLNDVAMIDPQGMDLDGQWCDDVHHALHSALTGETFGYYVDFGSLETLAKALTNAFVHDGTWSTFRGRAHGKPVPVDVPGHRFVVYAQDHDQVGNRAVGDRPALTPGLQRVSAALTLLSPYTPMLFMGEEYGATTPWLFFSDHSGSLGDAVRKGRRREFAEHGWDAEDVPDPQSAKTFEASTLDWVLDEGLLRWNTELIAFRKEHLADDDRAHVTVSFDEDARWLVLHRGSLAVCVNLSPERRAVPVAAGSVLLASEDGWSAGDQQLELPAESVVVVQV